MKALLKKLGRPVSLAVLVAALMFSAQDSARATGPLYGSTYFSKIFAKLGRGVGNIAFCWVEFPYEINHGIQNTDPTSGTFTGFFRGLYFTGQRLVLGVVDVVTFPIDIYGNNYQSIQRTEFPFIDEVQ
ncbi:exosortase system-associated protein, TIGR04073 family [Candidatus Sumerlaeota bacterium]|nr:exosortase system-associated protein, TIGR04073 family [Candidatus Sumerlaeota bacterium]